MASALKVLGITAGVLALWEGGWYLRRHARRVEQYRRAAAKARELGRELVVIGAPDGGVTAGYPCGDVTVDLAPSTCPLAIRADVTKRLPFADNSVVVFVSCVLEYVSDARAAIQEIHRISGGHAYFAGVEPWTLTAYLYPGAKRTLPPNYR